MVLNSKISRGYIARGPPTGQWSRIATIHTAWQPSCKRSRQLTFDRRVHVYGLFATGRVPHLVLALAAGPFICFWLLSVRLWRVCSVAFCSVCVCLDGTGWTPIVRVGTLVALVSVWGWVRDGCACCAHVWTVIYIYIRPNANGCHCMHCIYGQSTEHGSSLYECHDVHVYSGMATYLTLSIPLAPLSLQLNLQSTGAKTTYLPRVVTISTTKCGLKTTTCHSTATNTPTSTPTSTPTPSPMGATTILTHQPTGLLIATYTPQSPVTMTTRGDEIYQKRLVGKTVQWWHKQKWVRGCDSLSSSGIGMQ